MIFGTASVRRRCTPEGRLLVMEYVPGLAITDYCTITGYD